jgi:GNAT superfamily N-acetyltransferase
MEDADETPAMGRERFIAVCTEFFRDSSRNGPWTHWVGEKDGMIVAHLSVQRVGKMPKPNRIDGAFGYVANFYTKPNYRRQGIGTGLLNEVKQWAIDQEIELLVGWPTPPTVGFFERCGFTGENEAYVCRLEI